MKKIKLFSGFTAAAIAAAMIAAMPASAANYAANKQATGGTTSIQKYLVIDNDAVVPEATFEYEITAIENDINYTSPAGATGTVAAYAGVDADKITVGNVTFTAADAATAGAADDGITNSTDKKYVKKSFELDFSAVKFAEPGVYRYTLTEKNAGATDTLGAGIKHVGNYQKTLDVYVTDNNGTLNVSSYVLYNSLITTPPALASAVVALDEKVDRTDTANTDKTDGFVNEYESRKLTFAKKVTGNQGSKDKYFKFTVKIENANGATLSVDMTGAETETSANSATIYAKADMDAANSVDQNEDVAGQQLVIDSDEKSYDFYLQNGQYITLKGLPAGATYTVSEAAEEYTSTATDDENDFEIGTLTFDDAVTGDIEDDDIYTGFINNKNGSIPTGVILSVAGPAVIGLAVVGGIIYMTVKRKKDDAED